MLRLLVLAAVLQCTISQQYQQKVAPGVPPQNYQNYQQPPPPPPPQQQMPPQQQQQFVPPPQQQQYQPPPPQLQQQQQQFVPPPQQQFQQQPQHGHHDPQLLSPSNIAQEREHIQEHMDVPIDTSKMSEQELQFHYFKMHDADNNNKLDGCELIKSLIHWHEEHMEVMPDVDTDHYEQIVDEVLSNMDLNKDGFIGQVDKNHKTYTDAQLEQVLEHALNHTDINKDGYIDFIEYSVSNYKAKKAQEKKQEAQQSS